MASKTASIEPSVPFIYPDLEQVVPSAPPKAEEDDEVKTLRLKRISDIREYYIELELKTRGRYRRRYK